ncbi:MAG TPA: GyrI-like domain-containing protein [Tepidisphaeraceae bacterium]|nr:GyrI-like domain-containing protein [Tepidisphaeraceae bacterium]
MRKLIYAACLAALMLPIVSRGQTTRPAGNFVISPMHIGTLKDLPFMYITETTTIDTAWEAIDKHMQEMHTAIKDGAFLPAGPPVFVFHNAPFDRDKPFKLDVGFPVADGTVPAGDYQVGKLESAKAAVFLYMGPLMSLGQAYGRIYMRIIGAGYQPTGDRRERYLYFEDVDSPNNVIMIEIMIQ